MKTKRGDRLVKRIISLFLTILLSFSLVSCSVVDLLLEEDFQQEAQDGAQEANNELADRGTEDIIEKIPEEEYYTKKEDVALYLHTYGKLPKNYVNKKDAKALGWESSKGNLWDVTDQMSIGGDRFGNREKRLPEKDGRVYYECDLNYEGAYRGPERLVYSSDGLIYYTGDHYETFTLLYGDE